MSTPVLSRLTAHLPWPPRRPHVEIAYFSYSISGAGGETTSQEDIFTVDPRTGHVHRLTDDRHNPVFVSDRDPAWSPDRHTIAIHRGSSQDPGSWLYLISAASGRTLRRLVAGASPEWLDEETLLYLGTGGNVWAVDLGTLDTTQITDLDTDVQVAGMSWHPTAGLAFGYSSAARSSLATIPAAAVATARAGGSPVSPADLTFVTDPGISAVLPDWSPSADRLTLTSWQGPAIGSLVGYVTLATGAVTMLPGPVSLATMGDVGAVFSPDGRTIAFTREREDAWSEIWLHDLDSGISRRLTDEHEPRFKGALDW